MVQPSLETTNLASALINDWAGSSLPPSFAKLYSHHTRLRENQPGLSSWSQDEALDRLNDVVRLVEAAFVQPDLETDQAQKALRRAGELLEWLSLSNISAEGLAPRLLAAAAYQLAGYPARASGLLNAELEQNTESRILTALLKADFVNLFQQIAAYWAEILSQAANSNSQNAESMEDLHGIVVNETVSALGILCAEMRWGNEPRMEKALEKLAAVSKVLLHGYNPYSWLLAKLCAAVGRTYWQSSMRRYLQGLLPEVNQNGRAILERYFRYRFQSCQALAWTSQIRGIQELVNYNSFALCTPTGSGKTTVAELAILQSLFYYDSEANVLSAPLVIYLVPSKALATEVEARLSRVLRRASAQEVIVTGLYGGTDWGPTDVWLTSDQKTVLICTYEKAEALLKFLGPFFIQRIRLVVIDEAHTVQFSGSEESLQKSENRSLRLESLGARLFTYLNAERSRIIALSAVAADAESALAQWISHQLDASPIKTSYRSTRQLIGRLECLPGRGFEIQYDLLDGARLHRVQGTDRPYIPNPFPAHPGAARLENQESTGKRLRPYLFWAAMHLAAPDEQGRQRAVLVSLTQGISGYAEDFLRLLRSPAWAQAELPPFFQLPTDPEKVAIWERCLRSCEDYFGRRSREYQLLERGIVVHHGKMPGLMARLLVEVVDIRIATLVLATSTLSEGVNLPFETVLIPSLERRRGSTPEPVNLREFSNLVGRAGRPGFGTEGRSLVLLIQGDDQRARRDRQRYRSLISQLTAQQNRTENSGNPCSPLAELLGHLERQWNRLSGSNSRVTFLDWLEQTAPCNAQARTDEELAATETLDALDHVLLAAIVEIEQISNQSLSLDELESHLRRIWQNTYAHYATQEQSRLEEVYIHRGIALKNSVYRDADVRRRLYRTSLPPRSGSQLLNLYSSLRQHLATGGNYAEWSSEQRLSYVSTTIQSLSQVPGFRLDDPRGQQITWEVILRWWLCHRQAPTQPTDSQVADWHGYVSKNFTYRFNWGLGSVIALAIDESSDGNRLEPSLEDWVNTGLPWIVFWMKELTTWGTLDPVAAYLLARVDAITTRSDAERLAQQYYQYVADQEPNKQLNPSTVRDWVQRSFAEIAPETAQHRPPRRFQVELLRDFSRAPNQKWKVIPVEANGSIHWLDPAGFPLAACPIPESWQSTYLKAWDFLLDPTGQIVTCSSYT